MKPLEFKYKKLYDYGTVEKAIWKPIAYQVFPKGDYSKHIDREYFVTESGWDTHLNIDTMTGTNDKVIRLYLNINNPQQPFLVPAEHWEQFKQAVTEYNRKYCEQPDVKVLDDLIEWYNNNTHPRYFYKVGDEEKISQEQQFYYLIEKYKQTLEPEYFEEDK